MQRDIVSKGDGMRWEPLQYLRYADERARPFTDLVARIDTQRPGLVVDLGCGPGTLTRSLLDRWPDAEVVGVDSSPEMIQAARSLEVPGQLRFECTDLRAWSPPGPVDVLISNAALQ